MKHAALLLLGACYYASTPEIGSSGGDGGSVASGEFPCEVAETLAFCSGCHSDPPRGGAPFALADRADLAAMAPAFAGTSIATRALARMRDSSRPMPPSGLPRPSAMQIDAFAAWIDAGMPQGSCMGTGGGPDAGIAETICTSNQYWPLDWDDGSPNMNPGLPCRACHLQREEERAYFFMGTAFPTLHEKDRCFSIVPAGTRVEIIDANGAVALTMAVRAKGNFFSSSRMAGVALPFTARVITPNGAINQMSTPQMSGDCNGCHTEQGANGAPGRILLP
ncbi:MAG: hypothetical protein M4D80_14055 [Myxococcota bacterium]|nr:hypothetical protein [Myxococcota bacterium]